MYTLGGDISHHQGLMDWMKFSDAGAEFVFIRAGSINYITGVPYTDYQFEVNATAAPHFVEHLGYYWYFRANQDPLLQADYFCNLIEYKEQNLAPIIDVEATNGVSPYVLTTRAKSFIDRIEARMSVKPIIYTRASFWNPYTTQPSWALLHELWVARYNGSLTGPWSDGNYIPYPWGPSQDGWEYWQFSADGNGRGEEFGAESDDVDLNYKRVPFDIITPPIVSKTIVEVHYTQDEAEIQLIKKDD